MKNSVGFVAALLKGGIAEAFKIRFFLCVSKRLKPGFFSSFDLEVLSMVSCNFLIVLIR